MNHRERELAQLEEIVKRMVRESGSPEFDAHTWLNTWLQQPLPALGNATALEFLDQPGGFDRVAHCSCACSRVRTPRRGHGNEQQGKKISGASQLPV